MINAYSNRQCFFDDFLIDTQRTTATKLLHHPTPQDIVFECNAPWEGNGSDYFNMFFDPTIGKYRMYYLGWSISDALSKDVKVKKGIRVCYAQSEDGVKWEKPNLGICEFAGSFDNNILIDNSMSESIDNFFVMLDTSEDCPEDKRYKAIMRRKIDGKITLFSLFSCDGIHFSDGYVVSVNGAYDSLNTLFRDTVTGKYRIYYRDFHNYNGFEDGAFPSYWDYPKSALSTVIRDIRYIESDDFIHWTKPVRLDFGDAPDFALYTNNCMNYYRAPQNIIGFPTRYVERQTWTPSFDELCGKDARLVKMQAEKRMGLTVTDCLFMCSRDGVSFKRYDTAFIRPGAEFEDNWVYGSCYPVYGMFEGKSYTEGDDNLLYMLCPDRLWSREQVNLRRYALRLDGFVSLHADDKECTVVSKPFCFEGNNLYANMETSAWGNMYFSLEDVESGEKITSAEMFGDSVNKRIRFDGDVSAFAGKKVVLTVTMRDADLYSIIFE